MTKRKNKVYTNAFKQEAVALVTEQGYSMSESSSSLGMMAKSIYNWKAKFETETSAKAFDTNERA